jgi:flagellar motor protein MotB
MKLFWRENEHDNPAWPGLVDLFAFTMVLLALFLSMAQAQKDSIERENNRITAENADLKRDNEALVRDYQNLSSAMFDIPPILAAQPDPPQPVSQADELNKVNELIEKHGNELLNTIKETLSNQEVPSQSSLENLELKIHTIKGREISFDTAQWKLSHEDEVIITEYAPILYQAICNQPVFLIINGGADPRNYHSRTPPCDNVDLSALRAAAVAKLLEQAAPGIARKIRVVGLGAVGELIADAAKAEDMYRKYRSLSFVIRVNKEDILDSALDLKGEGTDSKL